MKKYLTAVFDENGIKLDPSIRIDNLNLVNSQKEHTLTFIDDSKYLNQVISNPCLSSIICTKEVKQKISLARADMQLIEHSDPRWMFYTAYNYVALKTKIHTDSIIDATTVVHPRAFVAEKNVKIGKHCIIHPNATILEDVEIGDNCVIQSGAVIGSEGYEYKRTSKGILGVSHDGKVIIGSGVDIGANTCVDKGFSYRNTVIGDDVKIDNLVYVAHAVHIDEGTFIIACAALAGSSTIGKNVWVGPNATVSHVKLADRSFVTLGSVVTRDTEQGQMVTGNWAIPHSQFKKMFIRNSKSTEE